MLGNYQNTHSNNSLISAFLWPFYGLISSLKNWRQPWAMNMFWVVCIYLGMIQIFNPEGSVLGAGRDGGTYVLWLQEMYASNISFRGLLSQFQIDAHTMDLYQPIVTFLVSRFTDNGHVLFFVFAFIFGYFYSRNIWCILNKISGRETKGFFLLIALFFLVCPITQINGVRMWTALHVFVYAMMPYLFENDKRKLWWLLCAPLIHFSFLYVSIFAVLFVLFFRNRCPSKFWIVLSALLFVVTFFINSINLNSISGILTEYSPESYESRISQYVDADVSSSIKAANDTMNWYVGGSGLIKKWFIAIFFVTILPAIIRSYQDEKYSSLCQVFIFAALIGSFANISALIPSGGRFLLLAQMFQIPVLLLALTDCDIVSNSLRKWYKSLSYALIIPFIVEIRMVFDYYGLSLFVGNYLTALFWDDNVMLIDYIKYFI